MKTNWTKWVGKRSASGMLLALYSFFAMLALFVSHGMWAHGGRLLVQEFPEEGSDWLWLSNCRIDLVSSIFIGVFSGLLVAFIVYILINSGVRRSRLIKHLTHVGVKAFNAEKGDESYSHITVGVAYLVAFFIVYLSIALLFDPHLLISIIDLAYLSTFAATGAICTAQCISHSRKFPIFSDRMLELRYLELEHASAREKLHLIGWGIVTGLITIMIVFAISGYYGVRKEVFNSAGYSICWVGSLLQMLTLIVGLGLGLIYQFWNRLDIITHRIKEIDHTYVSKRRRELQT